MTPTGSAGPEPAWTTAAACRGCGSLDLRGVLDLGAQPLANAYPPDDPSLDPADEPRYPLELVRCGACRLVQLRHTVDPHLLFDTYLYLSSYSTAMTASAAALAGRLARELRLGADDLVVEVASNDGYLLRHYLPLGVPVLGVEPAANVAEVARAAGVDTVVDYFGADLAARLAAQGRRASVLHANNVLAHVPDLHDFVAGIATVLRDDGVAVVETPWLVALVDGCQFDTVYHEHVYYHCLTALDPLLAACGLAAVDAEHLPLHGGSLRLTLARDGRAPSPAVAALRAAEAAAGVGDDAWYAGFADRVAAARGRTVAALRAHAGAGRRVAGYGAAAKGTVLLNAFGIGADLVEFVVDRNPLKVGRRMPGVGIPVRGVDALLAEQPDAVLLLAWNVAEEVFDQQREYVARGGTFLLPLDADPPEPAAPPGAAAGAPAAGPPGAAQGA